MSDVPIRFALIGCGSISTTHADALAALSADAKLTACCDTDAKRASDFAQKWGLAARSLTEILRDPEIDAVTVCVPSGLHAEIGVAALNAGKHVVVEKPMDISLVACDALIDAQKRSGKALAVISQHRFDDSSILVRKALDENKLGKILLGDARVPWYRTQEYYDSGEWRGTWGMDGGGALMNQGVHTADLLRWFCGPVATVYAQAITGAHERIEVEDAVSATITFENGAIGTLMASTAAYPGFPASVGVHGTEGSAVIEGDALDMLALRGGETIAGEGSAIHALQVATGGTRSAVKETEGLSAAADPTLVWGFAHQRQFENFIHCCRTGETPLVDGVQGRNAVELVLAVYESARTGKVVRVGG